MVKIKCVIMKDNIAVSDFAKKYFVKEIFSSPKTDFICEKTQSPEKPRVKEITESFNISGIFPDAQCLIPVVISRMHNTNVQRLFLKSIKTNFETTEKMIM